MLKMIHNNNNNNNNMCAYSAFKMKSKSKNNFNAQFKLLNVLIKAAKYVKTFRPCNDGKINKSSDVF